MITLPVGLNEFMKGQKLDGLKPFALLYRNKWDSVNNKFALEDTPIDISDLISKPNTLSMTLDVNEVAQYNANNVTLTLSDTKNYFVEGTPNSYFPEGYQIYGSRIVLYYGTDGVNRTPLFTGVIKELPTHKPENYQVDVKLVSPLEMLKDIEAKDFSDKVTGEVLTYVSTDSQGHRIYKTTEKGIGGFSSVYANGTKLYEGVEYEVSQLNLYSFEGLVTITNPAFYDKVITADFFVWKKNLTIDQIIQGLAALGGYTADRTRISSVVWNNAVRNYITEIPMQIGIGYYQSGTNYIFNWFNTRDGVWQNSIAQNESRQLRTNILPANFETEFDFRIDSINYSTATSGTHAYYMIGTDWTGSILNNGMRFVVERQDSGRRFYIGIDRISNGSASYNYWETELYMPSYFVFSVKFRKIGTSWNWYVNNQLVVSITFQNNCNQETIFSSNRQVLSVLSQRWSMLDNNGNKIGPEINRPSLLTQTIDKGGSGSSTWGAVSATLEGSASSGIIAYFSSDGSTFDSGTSYDLEAVLARSERYLKFLLQVLSSPADGFNVQNINVYYLDTSIYLQLVNLSDSTVLEALQDFALISGYEFGVDRQGVFFFRPRVASTTPTYILDHDEIVKVDTVKKNLSDFFTKLTLTFAQVPLEFYANTGERPTPIDKYGIINKEIDKPDIVNYDNPELAQAIGPQLLEVYSAMPNVIQVVGKLNLAMELGDIVSLRRNMNLITPEGYTDYSKYKDLNTYYRACKITGMNYNFSKKQITYTLRDVSNKNTEPQYEFNEYIYDFAVPFGLKE